MWHYYNNNDIKKLNFYIYSNIIKEYLLAVSLPQTDNKILKKIEPYFQNNSLQIIREFHRIITSLTLKERQQLREIIKFNLNIENTLKTPENFFSYEKQSGNSLNKNFGKEIVDIIREFCNSLWEYMKGKYLDEYYDFLYKQLKEIERSYCPACGMEELKSSEAPNKKSPIDHFIPKGSYPFVSFNIDNLFLICEECNNKKRSKIILEKNHMFFPRNLNNNSFDLKLINVNSFEDGNFEIEFLNNKKDEKIEETQKYIQAWDQLFEIKKRLKYNLKVELKSFRSEMYKIEKNLKDKKHIKALLKIFLNSSKTNGNITRKAYLEYKLEKLRFD